jgi:hypothetical protein
VVDTIRIKRPPVPPTEDDLTGRVQYDDRGNAIWQWKDEATLADQLEHPKLSIADEAEPVGPVKIQNVDAAAGYDPYGSGLVNSKEPKSARKDLRALSKWIELKRQRGEKPKS